MTPSRLFLVLAITLSTSFAQTDPGAKEDQDDARQKLLRAEDQLDAMTSQIEAMHAQSDQQKAQIDGLQNQLTDAKNDLAQLKNDMATMKDALEKLDAARAQERDVLLKKVAEIVADATKPKPANSSEASQPSSLNPAPTPNAAVPAAVSTPPAAAVPETKGYYYIVKKGDTLYDIAAAYTQQGVKVTVNDLRKANNLEQTTYIHVGQKLFIPKSD